MTAKLVRRCRTLLGGLHPSQGPDQQGTAHVGLGVSNSLAPVDAPQNKDDNGAVTVGQCEGQDTPKSAGRCWEP